MDRFACGGALARECNGGCYCLGRAGPRWAFQHRPANVESRPRCEGITWRGWFFLRAKPVDAPVGTLRKLGTAHGAIGGNIKPHISAVDQE